MRIDQTLITTKVRPSPPGAQAPRYISTHCNPDESRHRALTMRSACPLPITGTLPYLRPVTPPTWLLLVLSGLILGLAYPPNPIGLFGSIGLVPLLVALERAKSWGQFEIG